MTTLATLDEVAPHLASLPNGASSTFWMDCLHYFVIVRTIGQGSFGRVYLVRNILSGGFYALKVMKKSRILAQHQLQHVRDEVSLLQAVDCPYIVKLERTFQDDENLYLLLEYVPGGELFSLLRQRRRMTREMATFYVREIVVALEYLHGRGIAYRDLKPENILIDRWGHVKLVDFGFAKKVPSVTWTMCGTPEYLAPEVIKGTGHGCAVDWWSLGVLMYELMAGFSPFFAPDNQRIYENVLHGRLSFPSHFDFETRDLITSLLTQDKSYRMGNMVGGSEDVLSHPFFRATDWHAIRSLQSHNVLPVFGLQPLGSTQPPAFAYENTQNVESQNTGFHTPTLLTQAPNPIPTPLGLSLEQAPPMRPEPSHAMPTTNFTPFSPIAPRATGPVAPAQISSPMHNIAFAAYSPYATYPTRQSPFSAAPHIFGANALLQHPLPQHSPQSSPLHAHVLHAIPHTHHMHQMHQTRTLTPQPPSGLRNGPHTFDPQHPAGLPSQWHDEELASVQSEAYGSSEDSSSMELSNRSYSCPPSSHHMELSDVCVSERGGHVDPATKAEMGLKPTKAVPGPMHGLPKPSMVGGERHDLVPLESRSPVPPIELQVSQLFLNVGDSFSSSPMISPHPSDTSEANLDGMFPEDVELNMDATPDLPEEPNEANESIRFCMSLVAPHTPPWIPSIDFLGDSSHFDAYEDDPEVRMPMHNESCRFPCLIHPMPYLPAPIQTEHGVVWPHQTILAGRAQRIPAAAAYGKPPHLPPTPTNDIFAGF